MKKSMTVEDYLKSLGVHLTFSINVKTQVPRIAELSNKTNQFIFNYKRYTASEVENIMDSANGAVVSVSLKDKLSDSGIIGTCVLKKNDNKAIVEECFVSCRALGRGLDEAIILGAIQRGITFLNIDRIYVEFKKGDRNLPAEKFYKEYFEKQNMTETRFSYEIPRNYIEFETVIK